MEKPPGEKVCLYSRMDSDLNSDTLIRKQQEKLSFVDQNIMFSQNIPFTLVCMYRLGSS